MNAILIALIPNINLISGRNNRPILRGRDIKRYGYTFADKWIIATFPALKLDIDDYPAVRDYLLAFDKRVLAQTGEKNIDGVKGKNARKKTGNKWFETQDQIAYWSLFAQPKIIYPDISQGMSFAVEREKYCISNTAYFMSTDEKTLEWLCHVLNSPIIEWYYRLISVQLGEVATRMFNIYVQGLPIPPQESDDLYSAYHLTEEEQRFIQRRTACKR